MEQGKIYSLEDGITALVTALGKNNTLISLNFAGNMLPTPLITIEWADTLGRTLKTNQTLKTLCISLQSETLKDLQYSVVKALFTDGQALTDLRLYNSELDPDIIATITLLLEKNYHLTHLDLSHTNIPEQDQAVLQGYIERNIKRNPGIEKELNTLFPPQLAHIIKEYANVPDTYTPPPSTAKTSQAPEVAQTQPSRLSQIWVWLRERLNQLYQFIIKLFGPKKTSTQILSDTSDNKAQDQTTPSAPNKTVTAQTQAEPALKKEETPAQSSKASPAGVKPKN